MDTSAKKTETAAGRMVKSLTGVERKAKDVDGTKVTLNTELKGQGQVTQGLEAIKNRSKGLDNSKITLTTSVRGARESIAELTQLEGVHVRLDGDKAILTAEVNGTEQGRANIEALQRVANQADGDDIRMKAEVIGTAQAISELSQLNAAADRADGRDIRLNVDRSGVSALEALGSAIDRVATRMRSLQVVSAAAIVPGFIAAIGALPAIISPAVAALGALAAGIGAGLAGATAVGVGALGTFAGALGLIATPITMLLSKLEDYDDSLDKISTKQKTAASAADTLASAERSAAKAAQGVADARISAAEGVAAAEENYQDALRGVEDAERTLARTRRDAASGVMKAREQAAEDIAQAEQDAIDALRDVEDAEQALTDARMDAGDAAVELVQAEQELADLRDGDEARNLAEAEDNLTRARIEAAEKQERYNEAVKEHGANSREARLAALDLRDAQRDVAEQEEELSEIRRFGSEELRRAKDNYRDAARGQYDAAQRVKEAEENLALARQKAAQKQADIEKARVEGAQKIAEAQRDGAEQVADAQRDLADAQRQAAKAQEGIAKAQADGQRQIADALASQEEAQLAVARAADKLAEAEQGVLDEVIPLTAAQKRLYDEFQRFKGIAVGIFTPAMDEAANLGVEILRLAELALPSVGRASLATMQAVTRAFRTIRAELMQPIEQTGMQRFLQFIPQWTEVAATAVGRLGIAFFNVFVHTLPYVMDFTNWLGQLAIRFLEFTRSAEGVQKINQFLAYSVMRAKELFAAIGNLAAGFWGLFAAFEQAGLVDQVWGGFVRLTEQFRQFTAAGTEGRASIVAFSNAAQPILTALWGLVESLVVQWFRVANAVMRMRDEMGRLVLPQFFKELEGALVVIGDLLIEAFRNFGPYIGPIIRGLAEFLKYAIALNPVLKTMTATFARLLEAFGDLSPGMKTAIASALSLRLAFAVIGPVLKALFSPLVRVLGFLGVGRGVAGIAPKASKAIKGFGLALGLASVPAWGIIAAITALAAGLVIAYRRSETFRKIVNGAFNGLKTVALPAIRALRDGVVAGFNAIVKFAKKIFGGLRTFFVGWWKVIRGFFTANPRLMLRGWRMMLSGMSKVAKTIFNGIVAYFKLSWRNLGTVFRVGVRLLGQLLQAAWRGMGLLIRTVWKGISQFFVGWWRALSALFERSLNAIWNGIKQWGRQIRSDWTQFTNWARDLWDRFWTWLSDKWSRGWDSLRDRYNTWRENQQRRLEEFFAWTKGLWDRFWTWVGDSWSAGWDALRDRWVTFKDNQMRRLNNFASDVKGVWDRMVQGAKNFGDRFKEALRRRFIDGVNGARKQLGNLMLALGHVLDAIGAGGLANSIQARGHKLKEPIPYARGGIYKADRGGIAGPGRLGIVGENNEDEAIINLVRRTPESQEAFRRAAQSPNAPKHRGPAIGNAELARKNAGRGPGMRQEGFGPATYTLVKPLFDIANKIAAKYGTPWNSYTNHPPGATNQPHWRERSVDWWGHPGRGTPIGGKWRGVAADAQRMIGGNLEYILTPANDPAGHSDHVHVSAYIGQNHPLATSKNKGGNQGGGGFDWMSKIVEGMKRMREIVGRLPGTGLGKVSEGLGQWGKGLLPKIKKFLVSKAKSIWGAISGGDTTKFEGDWANAKGGSPEVNRGIGQAAAKELGWTAQWPAWKELGERESGWRRDARNPSSGAYGIPQALPESKLPPAGRSSGGSNAGPQVGWMARYMKERYGGPSGALRHHNRNNWYEKGGLIPGRKGDPKNLVAHAGEIVLPQGVSENFIKFTEWMRELVDRIRGVGGGAKGLRKAPPARAGSSNVQRYGSGGIDHGTIPQAEWDRLIAAGWRGIPGDGREAIYPPGTPGAAKPYTVTHNGKVVNGNGQVRNIGAGVINRGAINRPVAGMGQTLNLNIRLDDGIKDEIASLRAQILNGIDIKDIQREAANKVGHIAREGAKGWNGSRDGQRQITQTVTNQTTRSNRTGGGRVS